MAVLAAGEDYMEYFIVANSFAAPFFSDTSHEYQEASSAKMALELFAKRYSHPCGLYAAAAYKSADAMHKGAEPLARWLCNHAKKMESATKNLGSYSSKSNGPGSFEINGKAYNVKNPKGGSATTLREEV